MFLSFELMGLTNIWQMKTALPISTSVFDAAISFGAGAIPWHLSSKYLHIYNLFKASQCELQMATLGVW